MASTNLIERQLKYEEDENETSEEETYIEWSNLIFLPFHPVFQLMVLICVVIKCTLGPIQSIYPIVYCYDVMDTNIYLSIIKYFYWYCCDVIYGLDTILHIIHRQVTEKAMRREHLPKSAFLLLIDIVSIIPFFRLIVNENCPPTLLFPNILAFSELLIIYRIAHYFELAITHSAFKIVVGFTLLFICFINCLGCFWLLLTFYGLCSSCKEDIAKFYDWRHSPHFHQSGNETNAKVVTYVYGTAFVMENIITHGMINSAPHTLSEFIFVCLFSLLGYFLGIFVLLPKIFAEAILKLRSIFSYHPHVQRLVDETKRRYLNPQAPVDVEKFYNLLWNKRSGIACVPEIFTGMPKYLRIDLKEDLVWPIFYHSPILRNTSQSFKRMLCELIISDYKLPGEKFFSGLHSLSNLYYLKSGIVQFISSDDGITPILSVTSGTVFGDVSFMYPPLNRRILVRCLTYCEILFLSRVEYLKTIHKYPEDGQVIIKAAKERMKHAKTLFSCKLNVRGLDRSEDENVVWLKKRWWEISHAINYWKKTCNKRDETVKCALPSEETVYHCAKYIGQLALCHETKLQRRSIFASVRFPWILLPSSLFNLVWNCIVLVTVFLVLILYPPMLAKHDVKEIQTWWFQIIKYWVNFVYIMDICVSLFTSVTQKENDTTNFASVMFERCKSFHFCLDVMAAFWIEEFLATIGMPEYYEISQMNRLIKIYVIFKDFLHWSLNKNPLRLIILKIIMLQFCFVYISGYLLYIARADNLLNISENIFFGTLYCTYENGTEYSCTPEEFHFFGVFLAWLLELTFTAHFADNLMDIFFSEVIMYVMFVIFLFARSLSIASMYLSCKEAMNFRDFVSNLKKYYIKSYIHEDLLKRLDRYLICHWKYYNGVDIMHPRLLKNEPFDIYWKVQGEVAENIIRKSLPFVGASSGLIRELAYKVKFLVLPKKSTVFLFGVYSKNVTWIVQGYMKCEFHDDDGKLMTTYQDHGYLLSMSSVFFGKSLRTYTAYTDCEVIHIKIEDFYKILKRYPDDWEHFETVIQELQPKFEVLYQGYMEKHIDYKNNLRQRIFHARASMANIRTSKTSVIKKSKKIRISLSFKEEIIHENKLRYLKYWMMIRVITVIISILTATLQGGGGAMHRKLLIVIGLVCDCFAWFDIFLKFFLAYYDDKGIVIYSTYKCAIHYFTRGFLMDMIGCFPWYKVLRLLINQKIDDNHILLINTACKYAHLYLVLGYFDYIGDKPTIAGAMTIIVKWQVFILLNMFGVSQLFLNYCISFEFDSSANLRGMTRKDNCWMEFLKENDTQKLGLDNLYWFLSKSEMHLLPAFFAISYSLGFPPEGPFKWFTLYIDCLQWMYAESLCLAQLGLMGSKTSDFSVEDSPTVVGLTLILLTFLYWFVMCYSVTLLVLTSRGNVLFQHGVIQLKAFLISERVDKKIIVQALAHFTYWWRRTNGINIHYLSNERLGVIFRQDLNYYFFHQTFTALDTLLNGGKSLQRQLASSCLTLYILPNHEIVREMDLTSTIYVLHRGKVIITQGGERVCTLTRGSIFGQLDGTTTARPISISATAAEHVDLLPINIKLFHETITDKVRETISMHPTSKLGYMMAKQWYAESPNDTVQYLIGIRQTVQLPWMPLPVEARHGNWYYRWLYFAWFIGPVTTAIIVVVLTALPYDTVWKLIWFLLCLDLIHLTRMFLEFNTMKLKITNNKTVLQIKGLSLFKAWYFYVDLISLLLPLVTFIVDDWRYQLVKLLRLRFLHDFYVHYCTSFKTRAAPILLKIAVVFLILHTLTCLWIIVACQEEKLPEINNCLLIDESHEYHKHYIFFDRNEWVRENERIGGCKKNAIIELCNSTEKWNWFNHSLKPKIMENDYIVAFSFIIWTLTHSLIASIQPINVQQAWFKVFLNTCLYLLSMWLYSAGISYVYTRYRELYQHDFNVKSLLKFLKQSGISPVLLESVKEYTRQIWKRQKGDWLPELAQTAPHCIRQDLFCALYIHHLRTPVLFRDLPDYFIRQLAARLKRIVVFPGKFIIQEGDINPCIYWIHEGEVEKWCTNKAGERRMISLLSTNGYFGFVPGLYPNIPFQFSYCTRTVVDIVFLRLKDWQDLLDGYPDLKRELYAAAKQIRRDIGHVTN